MLEEIRTTTIQGTGYFRKPVRDSLEQGKVAEETKEAIFQNKAEDERKRIQVIYNSRGKLIEYDSRGKRLNVLV